MIPLRPYQSEAIDATRALIRAGRRKIVLSLATGGGKTVIASHLIQSAIDKSSNVLFLAHRRELISQAHHKMVANGIPADRIGIIMADTPAPSRKDLPYSDVNLSALMSQPKGEHCEALWNAFARYRPTAPVQIASVQTLIRRPPPADIKVIIIDECHLSLANSYTSLVAKYPDAIVIGLTATPERADGKGLGELYEELVVIASPRKLMREIDQGTGLTYLCTPDIWTVPVIPDLTRIKKKGSDFDEDDLADAFDRGDLIGNMIEHWRAYADGLRTVAFAVNVKHSRHIAEMFNAAGIPAAHLDGNTPEQERRDILARLSYGDLRVVANCNVLCEGWDDPNVDCAILARATESRTLHIQQVGRILRNRPGKRAIILDHCGNVVRKGAPHADYEYSLQGKKKRKTIDVPSAKVCLKCWAISESTEPCCVRCGEPFPLVKAAKRGEKTPNEQEGKLVKYCGNDLETWDAVVAEWRYENTKRDVPRDPKWCFVRFREVAGHNAPRGVVLPKLSESEAAFKARVAQIREEMAGRSEGAIWKEIKRVKKLVELDV